MSHQLDALHNKLVTHIVRQDRMAHDRAIRAGRYYNPNALALMLGAAQTAQDEAAGGSEHEWIDAVLMHFTATRPMHTFMKKIDPTIAVDHGNWIWNGMRY